MSIETMVSGHVFEHYDEDDNHIGKCVLVSDLADLIRAELTGYAAVEAVADAVDHESWPRPDELVFQSNERIARAALAAAATALGDE